MTGKARVRGIARRALALAAWSLLSFAPAPRRADGAEEVTVPPAVQAQLLARLATYQRNLAVAAGETVHVVVLSNGKDTASARYASQMLAALGEIRAIRGANHEEEIMAFPGAAALLALCKQKHVAALVLGPGLGEQVRALGSALQGSALLTVAAVASYVGKGAPLGFAMDSGHSQLLVDPVELAAQKIDLPPGLIKVMKVYP